MATITSTISNVVFSSYDSTLGAYRRVDFTWALVGATSTTMTALTDVTDSQEIDIPTVSSPHTGTFTLDYTNMTPTSWDSYSFIPGHTVVLSDIANGYWDGTDTITGDSSLGVVPAAPAPSGAPKLYGSVNGLSKEVKTLYGSVNGQSKELTKLYSSVNGLSKLIYEKQAAITYGTVYYKVSSRDTDSVSVQLQSLAEFNSLCNSSSSWSATIGGGTVTVNNRGTSNIIVGFDFGNAVTNVGDYFLYHSTVETISSLENTTITTIGDYFLGSSSIGGAFTLPSTLTTIGDYFLNSCSKFNQSITLPSALTSIGTYFLAECNKMVGTVDVGSLPASIAATSNYTMSVSSSHVDAYTTGITIAGSTRAAWKNRFPDEADSVTPLWRKLLDAGY